MVFDEETYDMVDEYLQSGMEIFKQMYEEYGDEFYNDFDEYFDEFRDRTYELTEEAPDDMLEFFKDKYMKELNEKLNGKVTPIATVQKDREGKLKYDLRVCDTSIVIHKTGRRVEWGTNTPTKVKSLINDIVYN